MAQKYRIYINEKVILITEKAPENAENHQLIDGQTFNLKTIYPKILKYNINQFYVICEDAKEFIRNVEKSITLIEAAGGLVKNEEGNYLFIYRNDKWDLPKGKLEKDESRKEGAVREVEEECGITVSKLGDKICKTYHVYTIKRQVVLKKTHWYAMKHKGNEKLKPQKEEGITDVRWFKKGQVDTILQNTFPSIVDVLVKTKLIKERPVLP
ncbi:NUDIX domain-containing protein [Mucilaginibacter sp. UR6-1]|uniref:NUDIX hydrolase n=1 Tax=Mucilaginibacter sp. UR6-1 TaxID=1435643 RepID=UPI001E4247E4|nr:NUDIX domain-containing protein [Mucilaginibacter sp. UR6-1]MCC8407894.1 NUDIX domain-containing protein [Mucilaginibacter sp. UR6-1]